MTRPTAGYPVTINIEPGLRLQVSPGHFELLGVIPQGDKWVDVKRRLPKPGYEVLVAVKYKSDDRYIGVRRAVYVTGIKGWLPVIPHYETEWLLDDEIEVTHWQHLPALPGLP